ncbi:ribonuclease E/G [Roseibacterium sp. SDUM158017]|uniref:Rne/Rng family ribonuclease n=1 Tax=Roseicyclus salinarum TaxID=3036773 RepID=UPI0024150CA8|nr:ribonuclease E/G [Roseibacterium sp. SDUM158017]MDG4649165.1 ribonuclease E/G [Roseibacterium sp. SDUM158017]
MAKKMLIDATHPEETRVVVVDGTKVEEFDFESLSKRQLAGNIYLAKITRVEPSLQAAFVDYGGNRHGFLAFSEIHPDYYQIPTADREALLAEEREMAEAMAEEAEEEAKSKRRRSRGRKPAASKAANGASDAVARGTPSGMDVVDLDDEDETAGTTPVEGAEELSAAVAEDTAGVTGAAPGEPVAAARDDSEGDSEGDGDDEDGDDAAPTAETVADDDTEEDIRPVRKVRARKYKIQEVVKVRQIMLVQVVKEERGNKGAALTTYLSLAGRYCVLMPNTARGGGISRKITNAADRKKLKEIAQSLDVPQGAGLIIRTAGSQRTKTEIKRDYEYLQRQWEQVRELTLKSIAPAPIYQEGDLIHRTIRDLYNRDIDEVLVEGEAGYRQAKNFMKMIMPSHAKNVKHYNDPLPIFARYKVEGYLADMFNPVVQLKSGGYIVIGVTEALVAIDVNSGRATKEGSIEETATKTNLEAAEEVARQVRLRDLAGLIVIDFIDMDERRNNVAVEKRIKDKLKTDRARIQVGRISTFGLMEMSRQRLRPGMLEATTQPCPHCHGTGLLRSDDSLGLSILRQLEEEGTRGRAKEVLLTAPVGIVNFLINHKRDYIEAIEGRTGLSIRIEADAQMISPDFKIERFKTATRRVTATAPIMSMDTALMDDIEEENVVEEAEVIEAEEAPQAPAASETDEQPRKKRRRRRGGRGRRKGGADDNGEDNGDEAGRPQHEPRDETEDAAEAQPAEPEGESGGEAETGDDEPKKKRRSRRGGRGRRGAAGGDEGQGDEGQGAEGETVTAEAAEAPAKEEAAVAATEDRTPEPQEAAAQEAEPEPQPEPAAAEPVETAAEPEPEPAAAEKAPEPEAAPEQAPEREPETEGAGGEGKPKRRGWWSLG